MMMEASVRFQPVFVYPPAGPLAFLKIGADYYMDKYTTIGIVLNGISRRE